MEVIPNILVFLNRVIFNRFFTQSKYPVLPVVDIEYVNVIGLFSVHTENRP